MAKYPTSRRLVLKHCPAREEASRMADQHGWTKYSEMPIEEGESDSVEVLWRVRPGLAFFYVENYLSDDCAVGLIWSEPPVDSEGEELLREIEQGVDVWSVNELLGAIDTAESDVELARALMRAALGAPVDFDPRFLERISRALSHPEPMVRETAVAAMMYPAWPQFRPVLRKVAQEDPSERVLARAMTILESYDRVGVPNT